MSVDFPLPLAPSTATRWPRRTVKSNPHRSTVVWSGYTCLRQFTCAIISSGSVGVVLSKVLSSKLTFSKAVFSRAVFSGVVPYRVDPSRALHAII